jgi:hypothetical protein
MPYQDSWVELWLGRYCAPGKHRFRPLRPDVVICERCLKEELTSGGTCLVCGIPGEVDIALFKMRNPGDRRDGRLCGECLDEFQSRRHIRGWAVDLAS